MDTQVFKYLFFRSAHPSSYGFKCHPWRSRQGYGPCREPARRIWNHGQGMAFQPRVLHPKWWDIHTFFSCSAQLLEDAPHRRDFWIRRMMTMYDKSGRTFVRGERVRLISTFVQYWLHGGHGFFHKVQTVCRKANFTLDAVFDFEARIGRFGCAV